jgi:hypothetical protein
LGFILGEPIGLTGKFWVTDSVALDWATAWSFRGKENDAPQIHGDILIHNLKGAVRTYYGIGAMIKFSDVFESDDTDDENKDKRRVGVRVPVGIIFKTDEFPWEIFIEMLPVADLAPKTKFDVQGAIGFRYYFGVSSKKTEDDRDYRNKTTEFGITRSHTFPESLIAEESP